MNQAPVAVAAGALAAVGLVATVDPEQPGHYPTCPFLSLTGQFCPGCGSLRAVHALTRGDLSTAVSRNVLAVAAIPLLVALWFGWAHRVVTGAAPRPFVRAGWLWALLAGVLAFWVLRNVPGGSWLAP